MSAISPNMSYNKNIVAKAFPQSDDVFTEYLVNMLNSIPNKVEDISFFDDIEDYGNALEKCKELLNYNNKKPTEVRYMKIGNNEDVYFNDEGKMCVKCKIPSNGSYMCTVNTGLYFIVPNGHILVLNPKIERHGNEHEYLKINCNPIMIDDSTKTVVFTYIAANYTSNNIYTSDTQEFVLEYDIDLFLSGKNYTLNNSTPKDGKSLIKNLKSCQVPTLDIKIDDSSKTITASPTYKFDIPNKSALLIFPRKRHHKITQCDVRSVTRDSNGSFTYYDTKHNNPIDSLDHLSYAVVTKYINNITLKLVDTPPKDIKFISNGGFNGWFNIYDNNYADIVQTYKNGQKHMQWKSMVENYLILNKLYSEENINKVLESATAKNFKLFRSENSKNNTKYSTIEEMCEKLKTYHTSGELSMLSMDAKIVDNIKTLKDLIDKSVKSADNIKTMNEFFEQEEDTQPLSVEELPIPTPVKDSEKYTLRNFLDIVAEESTDSEASTTNDSDSESEDIEAQIFSVNSQKRRRDSTISNETDSEDDLQYSKKSKNQ